MRAPLLVEIGNPATTEAFLKEKSAAIRALARNVLSDVLEIGRHLVEAKERVGHGSWLRWLKKEFAWSEQTARNFMNAHDAFGANPERVLDLNLPLRSFYKLAAPSTPEAVRVEILDRVGEGETVRQADIKEVVDRVRSVRAESKNEIVPLKAPALARGAPYAFVAINAQADSRVTTGDEILTSGKLQVISLKAALRDLDSFISRYGAGTPEAAGLIQKARAMFADKLNNALRTDIPLSGRQG
jgi:hypothetical protein